MRNLKRIAHVYPIPGGGVQQYAQTLINGLHELDPDLDIAHFIAVKNMEDKYEFGGDFVSNVAVQDTLTLNHSLLNDCVNPVVERRFQQLLDAFRPDLVHFHDLTYLGASLIGLVHDRGIPAIVTIHDYWFICPRSFLITRDFAHCNGPNAGANCLQCIDYSDRLQPELLMQSMYRHHFMKQMLNDKAARVLVVSDSVKRTLAREGVSPDKLIRIYPAVHRPGMALTEKSASEVTHIGYIGAVSPHKGLHVLLDACRSLDPQLFRLSVYGVQDSLYHTSLQALARDMRNITFYGPYNQEELDRILNTIDVLVVPSICPETGPLVVQEALRRKVPVIGSNIGGIPEYVSSDYGALFEAGNSSELRRILTEVLHFPGILAEWKNKIPELGDVRTFVRLVRQVYAEVLDGPIAGVAKPVHPEHRKRLGSYDRGFLRRPFLSYQLEAIYQMLDQSGIQRLVIFGTGALGIQVAAHAEARGYHIVAFADNNADKHGTILSDIPVIEPNRLAGMTQVQAIVIASDWEPEICQQVIKIRSDIPVVGLYGYDPRISESGADHERNCGRHL